MDKQENNAALDFLEKLRPPDEDLRHKGIPKFDGTKYAFMLDTSSPPHTLINYLTIESGLTYSNSARNGWDDTTTSGVTYAAQTFNAPQNTVTVNDWITLCENRRW